MFGGRERHDLVVGSRVHAAIARVHRIVVAVNRMNREQFFATSPVAPKVEALGLHQLVDVGFGGQERRGVWFCRAGAARRSCGRVAWAHLATRSLRRYPEVARDLGSEHWMPVVALAESALARPA